MKNYYQILDLQPEATVAQIKKQYKLLLRTWKPENFTVPDDIRLAEEKTNLINEAYDTLSDPIRREAYDQTYKTYADQKELPINPIAPVKDNEADDLAEKDSIAEQQGITKNRYSLMILAVLGVVLLSLLVFILINLKSTPGTDTPPALTTGLGSVASMTPGSDNSTPSAPETPAVIETIAAAEPTVMPTVAFTASDPATCQPDAIIPVVSAETDALFESASANDWIIGPSSAAITIYEYSDFQCPFCAKAAPSIKQLQAAYPKDVRVVFRHFPLSSIHPNAVLAAQAAEAAGAQNKFWQMHDLLFERQSEWSGLSTEDFKTWLKDKAKSLNLNSNQFMLDLVSDEITHKVSKSESDALADGLNSTPTLLFNKIRYQGRTDLESLTSLVQYFLLPKKGYTACPEMTIDPEKTYTATIKTEKGDVVIELYPKQAPVAVNSFVFLVRNNWFTGSSFFRVIPGFVAQAGDPSNSSLGAPGYLFTNEVTPELRFDKPGVMGMANSGNNDNGSQFFFTYAPVPDLDGKYTIFGQVIDGMDVLSSLRPRNPASDQILITPDAIISITIEEK
jgi:cyclophilin family peptidyl-prolyl cis-trans isomerase/protein-disulfide isomerase